MRTADSTVASVFLCCTQPENEPEKVLYVISSIIRALVPGESARATYKNNYEMVQKVR